VLWLAIMLLVLLLFLIRKSFAIISVPAVIALLAYVMRHAQDGLEEVIVYGMTWLLLISGCARRRGRRRRRGGCRKSQQNYSHSQPDLGSAVAGWHAPGRRRRREVAGPAIMNHPRCRVTTVARAGPRGGRSTRGPACT